MERQTMQAKDPAAKHAGTAKQDDVPEIFAWLGFSSAQNPENPAELEYEDIRSGFTFSLTPAQAGEDEGAIQQIISAAFNAGRAAGRREMLALINC
jgi:hypothetical protein